MAWIAVATASPHPAGGRLGVAGYQWQWLPVAAAGLATRSSSWGGGGGAGPLHHCRNLAR